MMKNGYGLFLLIGGLAFVGACSQDTTQLSPAGPSAAMAPGGGATGWPTSSGSAELNASMIASGMGPVDRMEATGAKLFAAVYALFSGLVFIGVVSVVLAPWVHRLFHWIHLDD